MADASYSRARHDRKLTAQAAIAVGEVWQLADGRAAASPSPSAAASGDRVSFRTDGQWVVTKAASQVWIDGAPIWWDHSANSATCVPPLTTGDRDFFLGAAVGDAASADTTGTVNLNVEPAYIIDLHRDGGDTAVVLTSGSPYCYSRGGTLEAGFSGTAEAQKLDWLSRRSFPLASQWVLEAVLTVATNADAAVADLNVGVANGTHASDFGSIAEFVSFHLSMGTDLNLDLQSDDGTTDVGDTDTTIDWAVGTPLHLVLDGRDSSDVQCYVNGVLVAGATVFTLGAASGPLKAIFHLEKTSDDSPGVVQLDMLRVRIAEQRG